MTGVYIRRMLLLAVASVLLTYGLAGWCRGWALGVDSSVYRAAAVLFLHGHSPYAVNDLGYLRLSFTYPPAAALLLAPLAFLPAQLAWAVMASASVLALALAIRVSVARAPYWRFPAGWSALVLTGAMLCLLPVWRTVGLGQVNIFLMAMVTVDVLVVTVRRSPWGGLLTGVAATVILVPLIFIPHLFLTGKRAAAARALAAFAGVWVAPAVVALLSWLQLTGGGAGRRGGGKWPRWAGVSAVIAVFTSTYSVPISQQHHRTLGPFWFFVLSNLYVLTAIAIALVLGICWLRRAGSVPVDDLDESIGGAEDEPGHRQSLILAISTRAPQAGDTGRRSPDLPR
ncbi:MAG: glycosyltransferase family 87 protein [Streptosporangiaceae bacterium]